MAEKANDLLWHSVVYSFGINGLNIAYLKLFIYFISKCRARQKFYLIDWKLDPQTHLNIFNSSFPNFEIISSLLIIYN